MAKKFDATAPLSEAPKPKDISPSEWQKVVETFPGLTCRDRYIAEQFASLHKQRRQLLEIMGDTGAVSEGSQGQEVVSPAARQLNVVEAQYTKVLIQLGGTPKSRDDKLKAGAHKEAPGAKFLT